MDLLGVEYSEQQLSLRTLSDKSTPADSLLFSDEKKVHTGSLRADQPVGAERKAPLHGFTL